MTEQSWRRALLAGLAILSGFAGALLPQSPSLAGTLAGDTIQGSLQFCSLGSGGNVFAPASGTAPLVFDYIEGANIDTAIFSATQLTVQDQVDDFACGWGMRFTNTTTPFQLLNLVFSDFSPGLTFDLTDGIISISWTGASGPQTFTAVFDVVVPEPVSLLLFGVGLAGITLVRRKCHPEMRTDA